MTVRERTTVLIPDISRSTLSANGVRDTHHSRFFFLKCTEIGGYVIAYITSSLDFQEPAFVRSWWYLTRRCSDLEQEMRKTGDN